MPPIIRIAREIADALTRAADEYHTDAITYEEMTARTRAAWRTAEAAGCAGHVQHMLSAVEVRP